LRRANARLNKSGVAALPLMKILSSDFTAETASSGDVTLDL
jgi:hypothetical protein